MKRALPPFNYIVVADAVFRNGSFKGAAGDLNVTPSAISHQVKGLEDWLGFELFSRDKKTIVTTPLGQAFLSRISEQLDGIEDATRDTLEARGARQTLKVQTTDSFARMVLIKRVARLKQAQKKLGKRRSFGLLRSSLPRVFSLLKLMSPSSTAMVNLGTHMFSFQEEETSCLSVVPIY